jgi:hypothetical protein
VEGKQVVVYEPELRDRRFTGLSRIWPDQIGIEHLSRFLLALQHDTRRSQASAQLLNGHVGTITACQVLGSMQGARSNRTDHICAQFPLLKRHGVCPFRLASTRRSLLLALALALHFRLQVLEIGAA